MNSIKICKTSKILKDIDFALKNKKPFSLLRFGDGGLKLIEAIILGNEQYIESSIKKEGLPKGTELIEMINLWGYYARMSNYIDSPEVYTANLCWSRIRGVNKEGSYKIASEFTSRVITRWRELYSLAEIDNVNFCHPDVNFMMITKQGRNITLFDLIKDKRICLICSYSNIQELMRRKNYNVVVVKNVNHYENQYEVSFFPIINYIERHINDYDIWLVSAGELGRLYTGLIKDLGGISVDVGSCANYWSTQVIPARLKPFMIKSSTNVFETKLKDKKLFVNF